MQREVSASLSRLKESSGSGRDLGRSPAGLSVTNSTGSAGTSPWSPIVKQQVPWMRSSGVRKTEIVGNAFLCLLDHIDVQRQLKMTSGKTVQVDEHYQQKIENSHCLPNHPARSRPPSLCVRLFTRVGSAQRCSFAIGILKRLSNFIFYIGNL
uniref:Uncharacterized protein n=1 Tax=Spongospora subterranea TaxID=70186 RepID=A0A0H5RDT3_9EUKA|eukprot:CRZ12163.1 hypothetical protein [Spongospora subterranea]